MLPSSVSEFHIRAVRAVVTYSEAFDSSAWVGLDDHMLDQRLSKDLDKLGTTSVEYCMLEAVCKHAFSSVIVIFGGSASGERNGRPGVGGSEIGCFIFGSPGTAFCSGIVLFGGSLGRGI